MTNLEKIISRLDHQGTLQIRSDYDLKKDQIIQKIRNHFVYIFENDFYYYKNTRVIFHTTCVTSPYGYGCHNGSKMTPDGLHFISECIGHGYDLFQKFEKRIPTKIVTPPKKGELKPGVYGRIFRLEGAEEKNKNTKDRGIYIHGNIHDWYWETESLKKSVGCIGLRLDDMKEIFDIVRDVKERIFVYIEGNE